MIRNIEKVTDMMAALSEEQRDRLATILSLYDKPEELAAYLCKLPEEDAQPFADIMTAIK